MHRIPIYSSLSSGKIKRARSSAVASLLPTPFEVELLFEEENPCTPLLLLLLPPLRFCTLLLLFTGAGLLLLCFGAFLAASAIFLSNLDNAFNLASLIVAALREEVGVEEEEEVVAVLLRVVLALDLEDDDAVEEAAPNVLPPPRLIPLALVVVLPVLAFLDHKMYPTKQTPKKINILVLEISSSLEPSEPPYLLASGFASRYFLENGAGFFPLANQRPFKEWHAVIKKNTLQIMYCNFCTIVLCYKKAVDIDSNVKYGERRGK